MFTGLVETVGKIVRVEPRGGAAGIVIDAPEVAAKVKPGDSVAVNGVCLTSTGTGKTLSFQAVKETLSRTTLGTLKPADRVNIELSLSASDRLGGHFVQGHVDGTGTVAKVEKQGGQTLMTISAPEEIMRLVVEKGSVAVDGVSLTVAAVSTSGFSVALVPFTLEKTNLGELTTGRVVNIETDVIGKYIRSYLERGGAGKITEGFLRENGFA